jgi:hypothetical protein
MDASTTSSLELLRYVDATSWVSGLVLVTLYSSALSANVEVRILLNNVSPAPDDPATLYLKGNNVTVTLPSAATAPQLFTAALAAPIGDFLQVVLEVEKISGAAETIDFTLGVKLVGRDA